MLTYIAIGIFAIVLLLIVFEVYDKSLIALSGALLMVLLGVLSPEQAIAAVDFDTIFLILGMMIMVNIAAKSGVLEWLNVKIAILTRGNPLYIFVFFSLITALLSTFLPNVTTILITVPLTIELVKGMGKDPKPYIFAEIFFANIGGSLTLIGDASNIIIGGASGLNFMDFLSNMIIPILMVTVFVLATFAFVFRKDMRQVSDKLVELCVANLTIRKIKTKFLCRVLHKDFVISVILVIQLTILGFILQSYIDLPNYVIAFSGAMLLAILTASKVHIDEAVRSVEWTTLFFFSGLFIVVQGVEQTGILEELSGWISGSTDNILYLALLILWVSGIVSMVIENIPFVTLMIPVIIGIQSQFGGSGEDVAVLWWALSMGACLGGCGTMIGGSANVVTVDVAKQSGVNISFMEYTKFGFPVTLGILVVCSGYLILRLT